MDAQTIVDTLSSLARAVARMEEEQAVAVAAAEAAADRAERAAERAAAQVEATRQAVERVLAARLERFSEAVRSLDAAQQELRQETAKARLRWSAEIPNATWLTAAVVVGMAIMVGAEIALAPLIFPSAPAAVPAAATERTSPPVQRPEGRRGRDQTLNR